MPRFRKPDETRSTGCHVFNDGKSSQVIKTTTDIHRAPSTSGHYQGLLSLVADIIRVLTTLPALTVLNRKRLC